jgi:inorganic phosphate transporter, PiT family
MTLILIIILVALAFEYINGFHDTANAIATSISTKVMTPREAIVMSTVFNLVGALVGTAVAKTIGQDLVDTGQITMPTILAALGGGIAWNLLTWRIGIPSSSSHALIGGLCGAALASAHGQWRVIHWMVYDVNQHQWTGLWPKVVAPMILAPVLGLVGGFLIMGVLLYAFRRARPRAVNVLFGRTQLLSAAWMSFSHGTNDAQKTMGIITLTLFLATTKLDAFQELPSWLGFLRISQFEIPFWVKVACALTMAAGTAAGGWRIIKTMGHHLVRMQPVHGFAAQTTAAAVIEMATHWGIPLSTTHVISGSIMGVGATKRLGAVKWGVAGRMVWAWVLTLPITACLSYSLMQLLRALGAA